MDDYNKDQQGAIDEQANFFEAPPVVPETNRKVCAPNIDPADLVRRYRHKLVSMLTTLTRDPHRAEDLAQDTLIIIIKRLKEGGIKEPDKLTAYIFSTARFLYFGWLRRRENQVELRESMEDIESPFMDQEDAITHAETARAVRQSLRSLSKQRDREILIRCYLDDQTKLEICEALLLSTEHYDRVLHRAKQRLRKSAIDSQMKIMLDD